MKNKTGFSNRLNCPWGVSGVSEVLLGRPRVLHGCFVRLQACLKRHRTANSATAAEPAMQAAVITSANAIAEQRDTPADGWFVVAPYGEHPAPDRSYTQVFTRNEADEAVRTWNSIPAKAFRVMKNLRHRLKPSLTIPIVEWAHVDTDPTDWSKLETLGEVSDVRATENALEVFVTWNKANMAKRVAGPLYPSIIWWHNPPDAERKVYPAHLESIALVPNPNISSVPAWTQNASPEAQTEKEKPMLKKLLEKLGLGAEATEDQATAKLDALQSTANAAQSAQAALTTANAAKADVEKDLRTANEAKQNLETERNNLRTANDSLVESVVNLLETSGKITPAEREATKNRFTANDAKPGEIVTELLKKKPVMNTQALELSGGKRIDISTANARGAAMSDLIQREMESAKCDYGTAFDRVVADPANKPLVDAMGLNKTQPAAA